MVETNYMPVRIPVNRASDRRYTTRKTALTNSHLEVLDGLMLGDGSISKATPRLVVPSIHPSYLQELRSYLPLSFGPSRHTDPAVAPIRGILATQQACHYLQSHSDLSLLQHRDRWYQSGKKNIPEDLRISPLSMVHWFYGDGTTSYLHHTKNYSSVKLAFATNSFPLESVERLRNMLAFIGRFNISKGVQPILYTERIDTVIGFYFFHSTSV